MSETRSIEVENVLKSMSNLVGYDLTRLDIDDEYTLNIFFANPKRFLNDEEIIKKVKEVKEILDTFNTIMNEEGRR